MNIDTARAVLVEAELLETHEEQAVRVVLRELDRLRAEVAELGGKYVAATRELATAHAALILAEERIAYLEDEQGGPS